ncbi:putative ferredoxin/ferredoxin-NADP reductase [Actinoplanes missouriensis 431]|uniref:ferredoxin--NADP(+) reductase n=1 Tax=Actinoplanes missouriensis (strain ATCC 14538 / DSM 43046 / CBS 188.64 / JCM 3121 / NBRC 102363 / NCIMB 12654 / NRRL B-3342 / UNCC 431) TaxID=512565 RepID=I0H3J7_ACTM4|nr:FAD-dependent oxidoreductase [Actinoplanes missouriensis]BAL87584.1 putative ferredoxin/ferredoxin-NADP reductase [Actinoplanes missouriensis 431]
MDRPLRVAVIGAGPAGIYAADHLIKASETVTVDIFDKLPTPYGLIRYGVAPDHPRIKEIVNALTRILNNERIRFIGNVAYGTDVKPEELSRFYDATVIATGAEKDRALDIPGIDLQGSFGAADFASWYNGHPDVPREWPLEAKEVAVIGAGNVAIDVARILAKTADELLVTEIPENVYQGLKASPVTDVHLFSRRGPAQVKFTPQELRELDHSPNVEVIIHPEGIEFDEGSLEAMRQTRHVKMCVDILQNWAVRDPRDRPRRLHLYFLQAPVEVLGEDGKVVGLRTETQELTGDGWVRGTGEFTDWPVQAVYRAVGYLSTALPDLPFDTKTGTIPHQAGRILDLDGEHIPGMYTTGWIKRGPVGLIGHTKGDANETVQSLLEDVEKLPAPVDPTHEGVLEYLRGRGLEITDWEGWQKLDAHEVTLGEPHGRKRIKVVARDEMTGICNAV